MAKRLTQFVKSIGIASGADNGEGVWDYSNTNQDAQACSANGGTLTQHAVTWCVPPRISTALFEIWGAGGSGAGVGTCCGIAPPSSSAAYAYKQISVTPGDCYTVYAGMSWCATQCTDPSALRIATWGGDCCDYFNTYVTGPGLINFCAEKGHDSCWITCGSFTSEGVSNLDSDTIFLWNDSENAPQATYYGADGGHDGFNGYTFTSPQGNPSATGQYCTWRAAIPYPAGLLTQKPGRFIGMMCCNQSGCVTNGAFGETFGYGNTWCCGAFKAGAGVGPALTCAGNGVCTIRNNPGRVRITYS